MNARRLIHYLMAFALLSLFLISAIPEGGAQAVSERIEGTFDYSATYEAGSRAGTQTHGHRVTIEPLPDGQYRLNWGDLKAMGARVGDGLIYRWKSDLNSGEGIYIIYDQGNKLFGTFRLKDEKGRAERIHSGNQNQNQIKAGSSKNLERTESHGVL